ncbi:MAG TPA: DNA-processing protein DprA [Polyangia bacterium]
MRHEVGTSVVEERERVLALALDPRLAWAAARREVAARAPELPFDAPRPDRRPAPAALAALAQAQGRAVLLGDPDFPPAVASMPAGPVGLFVRGAWPAQPMVAIVGARACTRAAARLAFALAQAAADAGWTVLSGGAVGIDAAAHEGALAGGGATVAVLGSGLDRLYPERNVGLFERIARVGAVVTPFPCGTAPTRANFPRRNGIVAALASHALVVEARPRSGALLTAGAARSLGRALGAVPGTVGCDRLLCEGARRVTAPADLLGWLAGAPARPVAQRGPTPEADRALRACDAVPRGAAEIAARAGLDEEEGRVALGFLELWGLVARAGGDRFVRIVNEEATHNHAQSA